MSMIKLTLLDVFARGKFHIRSFREDRGKLLNCLWAVNEKSEQFSFSLMFLLFIGAQN
jgi:hypothetical protein